MGAISGLSALCEWVAVAVVDTLDTLMVMAFVFLACIIGVALLLEKSRWLALTPEPAPGHSSAPQAEPDGVPSSEPDNEKSEPSILGFVGIEDLVLSHTESDTSSESSKVDGATTECVQAAEGKEADAVTAIGPQPSEIDESERKEPDSLVDKHLEEGSKSDGCKKIPVGVVANSSDQSPATKSGGSTDESDGQSSASSQSLTTGSTCPSWEDPPRAVRFGHRCQLGKLAVVLDLDETFVKTWPTSRDLPPFVHVPHNVMRSVHAGKLKMFRADGIVGVLRPGLSNFLKEISQFAIIHAATLGNGYFARLMADILDPLRVHIIYPASRLDFEGVRCKDLSVFHHEMDRLISIDVSTQNTYQEENVLSIRPFEGDEDDIELASVLPRIKAISKVANVRQWTMLRTGCGLPSNAANHTELMRFEAHCKGYPSEIIA